MQSGAGLTYRGVALKFTHSLRNIMEVSFLDLEKAFDMISHEVLLTVLRDTLQIPLEWVEAIRLILRHNKTTLLGHLIEITRGCLKGSPLSPLLCLCMIKDFTR